VEQPQPIKTDSVQIQANLLINQSGQISLPSENAADSLFNLDDYMPRLKELSQQLDSLTLKQKEIDTKLESLKSNSYLLQKNQQRGDLVNGVILILFIAILLRILLSWWQKSKIKIR